MNLVWLTITIALFLAQTFSMKLQKAPALRQKLLLNGVSSLLAALALGLLAVWGPGRFALSAPTLWLGALFGALFCMTILFYNLALGAGPMSQTAFYFSSSMLLPTLAGVLWFGEPARLPQCLALGLFLAAFYCLNSGQARTVPASPRWRVYCALAFLCNGTAAIVQKMQQAMTGGAQALELNGVGFASAALCCGAGCWLLRKRNPAGGKGPLALLRANLPAVLLLAGGSAGGNALLTFLAGRLPAGYLFPLVQGSIVVGAAVCATLLFGERLPPRGKLGLALGVAAIAVINL